MCEIGSHANDQSLIQAYVYPHVHNLLLQGSRGEGQPSMHLRSSIPAAKPISSPQPSKRQKLMVKLPARSTPLATRSPPQHAKGSSSRGLVVRLGSFGGRKRASGGEDDAVMTHQEDESAQVNIGRRLKKLQPKIPQVDGAGDESGADEAAGGHLYVH